MPSNSINHHAKSVSTQMPNYGSDFCKANVHSTAAAPLKCLDNVCWFLQQQVRCHFFVDLSRFLMLHCALFAQVVFAPHVRHSFKRSIAFLLDTSVAEVSLSSRSNHPMLEPRQGPVRRHELNAFVLSMRCSMCIDVHRLLTLPRPVQN